MDFLFPLLIIFMIGMIFFSSRQRKKQQQQQESLQSSINVGDVVVMTSGISGTVVDTDDDKTIDLEIAPEVITTWLRAAVREKLSSDLDTTHLDTTHLDTTHLDGAHLDTAHLAGHEEVPRHSSTTNGAPAPAPASEADATTVPEPKDSPRAASGGTDGGFSDPTATPSSNGVSAGSPTPGDSRPTS